MAYRHHSLAPAAAQHKPRQMAAASIVSKMLQQKMLQQDRGGKLQCCLHKWPVEGYCSYDTQPRSYPYLSLVCSGASCGDGVRWLRICQIPAAASGCSGTAAGAPAAQSAPAASGSPALRQSQPCALHGHASHTAACRPQDTAGTGAAAALPVLVAAAAAVTAACRAKRNRQPRQLRGRPSAAGTAAAGAC